jgi:hypothetical protein
MMRRVPMRRKHCEVRTREDIKCIKVVLASWDRDIGGGEDGWARNEVVFACILVFCNEQLQQGH